MDESIHQKDQLICKPFINIHGCDHTSSRRSHLNEIDFVSITVYKKHTQYMSCQPCQHRHAYTICTEPCRPIIETDTLDVHRR